MPLTIDNRGRDNIISYLEADARQLNGSIRIGATGSLAIGRRTLSSRSAYRSGNDCKTQIGANCNLGKPLDLRS